MSSRQQRSPLKPEEKSSTIRFHRWLKNLKFYLTPRFLGGLALIITALFASLLISQASSRTIAIWSTTTALAPGVIIEASSITQARVLLDHNSSVYLSAQAPIIGATVLRPIGAGELIPSEALTLSADPTMRRVALSISSALLPGGLTSGNIVDLYAIPADRTYQYSPSGQYSGSGQSSTFGAASESALNRRATLVLPGIGIATLDASARDIGGNTTVTLLIPQLLVDEVLSSLIDHQILIVKH
jgi:hypothetical protein